MSIQLEYSNVPLKHSFTQSTAGIVANGAGTALNLKHAPISIYTIFTKRTVGAAQYIIDLEGSYDGTNFVSLGTLTSNNDDDGMHVVNKACLFVRYNVTTVGAGNTLTVSILGSGR